MTRTLRHHYFNACVLLTALSFVGLSASCIATDKANDPEGLGSSSANQVSNEALSTPAPSAEEPPRKRVANSTCTEIMAKMVRPEHRDRLQAFCQEAQQLPSCESTEGRPIHHSEFESSGSTGKRILVLGLMHGDEPLAGEMTVEWSERLKNLGQTSRNSWRFVPMINPDGLERHSRLNARGVDLNRNFPTKDWDEAAMEFWKGRSKADPRRFPGESAGSEVETQCVIAHIKAFRPDFIVSVHTPYRVLDFDGPPMHFPRYKDLPWRALGNFPGSLGRYMWKDYQIPVLTVELGDSMVDAAQLQDIVGGFAIDAVRRAGQKTAGTFDRL